MLIKRYPFVLLTLFCLLLTTLAIPPALAQEQSQKTVQPADHYFQLFEVLFGIGKFDGNPPYGNEDGEFLNPVAVVSDSSGNIYVAEGDNRRVQKFDSTGNHLMTIDSIGSGLEQPVDVAIGSDGKIFVAESSNVLTSSGHDLILYNSAGEHLKTIEADANGDSFFVRNIAADTSGNIYLLDSISDDRLHKFDSKGDPVWSIDIATPGTLKGQLRGIDVDPAGNVLVLDNSTGTVIIYNPDTGAETGRIVLEPGGFGMAVDSDGTILFLEAANRVKRFAADGTLLANYGTLGTIIAEKTDIAIQGSGTGFLVTNQALFNVTQLSYNGVQTGTIGANGGVPLSGNGAGEFNVPLHGTTDSSGNVYIVEATNNRVQIFDSDGTYIRSIGPSIPGYFRDLLSPRTVNVDSVGNVYVFSGTYHSIFKFDSTGAFVAEEASGAGHSPSDSDISSDDMLYYLFGFEIRVFDQDSNLLSIIDLAAKGISPAHSIAIEPDGTILLALADAGEIKRLSSGGDIIETVFTTGFQQPLNICVDAVGNIYVYLKYPAGLPLKDAILKLGPDGSLIALYEPYGMLNRNPFRLSLFAGPGNNFYVVHHQYHFVEKIGGEAQLSVNMVDPSGQGSFSIHGASSHTFTEITNRTTAFTETVPASSYDITFAEVPGYTVEFTFKEIAFPFASNNIAHINFPPGSSVVVTGTYSLITTSTVQVFLVGTADGIWYIPGQTPLLLSGESWEVEQGTHTIFFTDVDGFVSPEPQQITIAPRRQYIFNFAYKQFGNLLVNIDGPPEARWRILGEEWHRPGELVEGIPVGEYMLEFSEVENYTAPEKRMVTISAERTTEINVSYTPFAQVRIEDIRIPGFDGPIRWRLRGSDTWMEGSADLVLAEGEYLLEFQPVPGWLILPIRLMLAGGDELTLEPQLVPFLVTGGSDVDGDGGIVPWLWDSIGSEWNTAQGTFSGFGKEGLWPVPGDYDGDGELELAVWSAEDGRWNIQGGATIRDFGMPGDLPLPADYDGDGKTDPALYRPSTGEWIILFSSDETAVPAQTLGLPSADIAIPVPGDYNGDGTVEQAVYDSEQRTWIIAGLKDVNWGRPGEIPVPADYDGDGATDLAMVDLDKGLWRVRGMFKQRIRSKAGDVPVVADYDGDGAADLAWYRPKNRSTWFFASGSKLRFGDKDSIPLNRGR